MERDSTGKFIKQTNTRYDYLSRTVKEHGDKDLCLLWPFRRFRTGYGQVTNPETNKNSGVHRLSLELTSSPA